MLFFPTLWGSGPSIALAKEGSKGPARSAGRRWSLSQARRRWRGAPPSRRLAAIHLPIKWGGKACQHETLHELAPWSDERGAGCTADIVSGFEVLVVMPGASRTRRFTRVPCGPRLETGGDGPVELFAGRPCRWPRRSLPWSTRQARTSSVLFAPPDNRSGPRVVRRRGDYAAGPRGWGQVFPIVSQASPLPRRGRGISANFSRPDGPRRRAAEPGPTAYAFKR